MNTPHQPPFETAQTGRMEKCYRPSGRVHWRAFALWSLAVLLTSSLLADLAFRLDRAGWYVPVVSPWIGGLSTAMLAAAAIQWGRCRNPSLGGLLGVLAGLTFFLGFFQLHLLDAKTRGSASGLQGVPFIELVGGLPNYIVLRMQNIPVGPRDENSGAAAPLSRQAESSKAWPDAERWPERWEVAEGAEQTPAMPPDRETRPPAWRWTSLRWLAFALELIGIVIFGFLAGHTAARRPYSERNGQWMELHSARLPRGQGEEIHSRLNHDVSLGDLGPALATEKGPATIILQSDPWDGESPEGYLSIRDVDEDGRMRLLLHRRLLSATQFAAVQTFLNPGADAKTTTPVAQ